MVFRKDGFEATYEVSDTRMTPLNATCAMLRTVSPNRISGESRTVSLSSTNLTYPAFLRLSRTGSPSNSSRQEHQVYPRISLHQLRYFFGYRSILQVVDKAAADSTWAAREGVDRKDPSAAVAGRTDPAGKAQEVHMGQASRMAEAQGCRIRPWLEGHRSEQVEVGMGSQGVDQAERPGEYVNISYYVEIFQLPWCSVRISTSCSCFQAQSGCLRSVALVGEAGMLVMRRKSLRSLQYILRVLDDENRPARSN